MKKLQILFLLLGLGLYAENIQNFNFGIPDPREGCLIRYNSCRGQYSYTISTFFEMYEGKNIYLFAYPLGLQPPQLFNYQQHLYYGYHYGYYDWDTTGLGLFRENGTYKEIIRNKILFLSLIKNKGNLRPIFINNQNMNYLISEGVPPELFKIPNGRKIVDKPPYWRDPYNISFYKPEHNWAKEVAIIYNKYFAMLYIKDKDYQFYNTDLQPKAKIKLSPSKYPIINEGDWFFTYPNAEIFELGNKEIFLKTGQLYQGFDNLSFKASSYLKEGKTKYEPNNMRARYAGLPWVEGVSGDGIGEIITITAFRGTDRLYLANGYVSATKPHLYTDNGRVKKIRIRGNGINQVFDLEDTPNFQELILPLKSTMSTDEYLKNSVSTSPNTVEYKMEILAVYKGEKFADTAINAIIGAKQSYIDDHIVHQGPERHDWS